MRSAHEFDSLFDKALDDADRRYQIAKRRRRIRNVLLLISITVLLVILGTWRGNKCVECLDNGGTYFRFVVWNVCMDTEGRWR